MILWPYGGAVVFTTLAALLRNLRKNVMVSVKRQIAASHVAG
jgi:hypothetical protein